MQNIDSLLLSFRLGFIVSGLLIIVSLPLALLFAFKKFPGKFIFETIFSLPIVLPPVVLGFYLLQIISPYSFIGALVQNWFGVRLAFSFIGIIIASAVVSFPFMFSQLVTGLREMDRSLIDTAWSLGKSPIAVFFKIIIPEQYLTIVSSIIICFAQVLGSFGIIVMVGGNIGGETNVVSIRLFEMVEALEYKKAEEMSLSLLAISFIILILLHFVNHKKIQRESLARRGM